MTQLPKEVLMFLNGERLHEKQRQAMHFITVDESGFPYKAMLSVGEVLSVRGTLRIALWPKTQSAANLKKKKQATLLLVLPPAAYDIQLNIAVLGEQEGVLLLEGSVHHVKLDQAPYATITNGVQYQLHAEENTFEQWHKKHELLRK